MRIIFGFFSKRFALKGLGNARAIGSNQSSARLSPYLVAPSGLIRVGRLPRVNPGATLFRPLRATDWPYDEAKFSDVTFYKCPKCRVHLCTKLVTGALEALSELDPLRSPIHLIKIVSNSQPIAAHAVPRTSQKTRIPNWYLVPSALNLSMT